MIFITIGTHPESFERLIRHIDKISPKIKEKIIIQRGFTKYIPKNVESFDFAESLDEYYKKSRVVIAQSATSLIEFCLKYDKPVITVPREKKYSEHINDHQVEFAEYFSKKTGILMIRDMNKLTPELLINYRTKAKADWSGISLLQKKIGEIIDTL